MPLYPKLVKIFYVVVLSIFFLSIPASFAEDANASDLTRLSLEDLMNVEIYSVAKKSQKLFDAPAAIYVITQDDIRSSAATTIPELLRMVPGVSVQKLNSHAWDISARGFNNSLFANKLLVLIDGRAVYTPLYGGVFWDVQDVVLEDIERIEVVRGPGGTLWGANAVNGVVNVITKKAKDTQGKLVSVGGGTEETGFATARYGGTSKDWHYRVYSKYFNRAEGYRTNGTANDNWDITRGGFKAEKDYLTYQGDFYQGKVGQRTTMFSLTSPNSRIIDKPVYVEGGNLMAKYAQEDWSLQGYWDMTDRDLQSFSEHRNTFDLEYNHNHQLSANQDLNWGLGYRVQLEDITNSPLISFDSPDTLAQIFSGYVQDEYRLFDDKLKLTAGTKLEHNIYTRLEVQPNARLAYTVNEKNMVWAAASRAVRTPSRLEEDATLTSAFTAPSTFTQTVGNNDLASEIMHGYELGYRTQPVENVFFDVALFLNQYDRLITFVPGPTGTDGVYTYNTFPTVNGLGGDVHGIEVANDIDITEWWTIKNSYTFTKMNLRTDSDIANIGLERSLEDAVPPHMFYTMSAFEFPKNFEFNVILKYCDGFSNNRVSSYTDMDLNLTKIINDWEFAVVGQNLFRSHRRESVLTTGTQVQRGGYAKVTRRF